MYDHDFLGRRVMKDVTGTTKKEHKINKHPKKKTPPSIITHFLYDRSSHVLAEADGGTGATGIEYIWLDDMLVGLVNAGTLYFVHPDHLGTPQKITDATQAITFDLVLRPFGQAEQHTFPSLTNLRFPGQYFDAEDDLHQNWFRDYDSTLGRYAESDPIGLAGGISTYAYAWSNPLYWSDKWGLQPSIPDPNGVVPGGPWKPAGPGAPPGMYYGPEQPKGPRTKCQWVPKEAEGGPPGSKGYWKTQPPNQKGWQRFDQGGKPITPDEAHPGPGPRPPLPPLVPPVVPAIPILPPLPLTVDPCVVAPTLCFPGNEA